jgi:tetratricopeptide (TPR) repeat protein
MATKTFSVEYFDPDFKSYQTDSTENIEDVLDDMFKVLYIGTCKTRSDGVQMSSIKNLHDLKHLHDMAMDAAEQSFLAVRSGDVSLAEKLNYEAFENEKKAAELLTDEYEMEPSRSVLFRSAATLAYECKEYREAEILISKGLSGNPPEEIAEELRDLLWLVIKRSLIENS